MREAKPEEPSGRKQTEHRPNAHAEICTPAKTQKASRTQGVELPETVKLLA
jgi:hypothetical protein